MDESSFAPLAAARGARLSPPDPVWLAERPDVAFALENVAAASNETRSTAGMGVRRIGEGVVTWAGAFDVLAANRALGFGLDELLTPERLDEIEACFVAAGVPRFMIQVSPAARPADLPRLLEARGYRKHNRWVKLMRSTATVPKIESQLGIVQIGSDRASEFADIVGGAFGFPPAMMDALAGLVGREGWRHYLAVDGDRPVGGAALFVVEGVGWLGAAGTRAEARGRGAQSALIARRVADAAALGISTVVTETAEETPERPAPSWRNMRRLGFQEIYRRPNWVKVLRS